MDKTASPKISYWKGKLKELEEVGLPKALKRLGESAESGDWHENAEYEDALREVELARSRIDEIKLMIKKLESKK